MPVMSSGGTNPYVLAGVTTPCLLNGNLIEINEGWESYRWNLGKSVRNEFDRCWRVFERAPGARLRVIDDAEQARRMLVVMDQQQRSRLTETGQQFTLDQSRPAALFRALVTGGAADGSVVLTVLPNLRQVDQRLFASAAYAPAHSPEVQSPSYSPWPLPAQ